MGIRITPDEMKVFAQLIHGISGIFLDASKTYLLENRLGGLLVETRSANFSELYARIKTDVTMVLQRKLLDLITTGETSFFRDGSPFDLLRYKLIPELVDRRSKARGPNQKGPINIRIWSAACSTGQEVYTIGITLKEILGNLDDYSIRILGTDISDRAVAAASKGEFNGLEIERGLPRDKVQKYFTPVTGGWKIRDEIRGMATFKQINLMRDLASVGKFDIVFCRNVAIYFNDQDRASVFNRIGNVMEPDGTLIIGSTESIANLCPKFDAQRHLRGAYYTLKN